MVVEADFSVKLEPQAEQCFYVLQVRIMQFIFCVASIQYIQTFQNTPVGIIGLSALLLALENSSSDVKIPTEGNVCSLIA